MADTITIRTNAGPLVEMPATIQGVIALHRTFESERTWTITHIPSGIAIRKTIYGDALAQHLFERIARQAWPDRAITPRDRNVLLPLTKQVNAWHDAWYRHHRLHRAWQFHERHTRPAHDYVRLYQEAAHIDRELATSILNYWRPRDMRRIAAYRRARKDAAALAQRLYNGR